MPQQIIVIHGGHSFKNYKTYLSYLKNKQIDFERYKSNKVGWKKSLIKDLGRGYEVILPDMPNKANAKYLEWKIWFKKFIPHLKSKVILIGHSLGGIFLAKYFLILSDYFFSFLLRQIAIFTLIHPAQN